MQKKANTFGKSIAYSLILLLLFSLSILFVNAQFKEGTCKNPDGGNYCGKKSPNWNCYCDTACTGAKDCCKDYQEVCLGGGSGGGGVSCVACPAPPSGCKYVGGNCNTCGKLVCEPVCGNNICEEGEADYCPPCKVEQPFQQCSIVCSKGTCPQDCATDSCTKYYTCPDGTKIKECEPKGTGCSCNINPGALCSQTITKKDVINWINNYCSDNILYQTASKIMKK